MDEKIKNLRSLAVQLPQKPGVYIMYNKNDEIIYIGKAKVLKNRVSQYFGSPKNHNEKVRKMVQNVNRFDYIVTDSEFEALVLECSLIKQHRPKYNILLKDDKGYSYVKITNEDWPKISSVLQKLDDGATYIGPYMSSMVVKSAVDAARKIFKLPDCNKSFSSLKNSSRACLNYYIKQCSAPCIGKIKRKDYLESVNDAIAFLKGEDSASIKSLTQQMNAASEKLDFETAAKIRDRINAIKKLGQRQKVISSKIKNQDVFAFVFFDNLWCAEVFRFQDGRLFDNETFFFSVLSDDGDFREEFILQYYSMREKIPPIITLDEELRDSETIIKWLSEKSQKKIQIIIPKKGEQFKILQLCKKNAQEKILRKAQSKDKTNAALKELSGLLNLKKLPYYIEAYDISNTMGSENVAGMVVFQNGVPLKSSYKRFKIKGFIGQDDYASMREVIERRFTEYRAVKDQKTGFGKLPDLILLDGGKTHVAAVKPILNDFELDIPVFGMVKDSKHRTRAITTSGQEINVGVNSAAFSLITKIQDEVHRFAIGYHRKLRGKKNIESSLTGIPGVGPKRAKTLFLHFKTLDGIKNASIESLSDIPGITRPVAENIYNYFNKNL